MLPYSSRIKDLFRENALETEEIPEWNSIYTPYISNTVSSSTDNYNMGIGTGREKGTGLGSENTNRLYRYSAFTSIESDPYKNFFNQGTIDWISEQITNRTLDVHPEGKKIIVPDETIVSIMDSFYNSNNSSVDIDRMREQVVLHIAEQISLEFQVIRQNEALTPWVQLYSMDTGLKRFNSVKLNENRRTPFTSWNY